jgi:Tryptophan-rich Synechocystis species C-terminal domain/Cadherin-like/RTX calcium-binding nonapeptide repeat (4 copies)
MTAQSLTIKMAVADPALTGVADPGSHIVYTIDVVPTLGTLTVNGVAVTDGGQFTQDQLDQGLVVYTDDGSGSGSDLFSYSISDPLLNHNLGSGSFDTQHVGGTLGVQADIFSSGSDPVIFFSEPGDNSISGTNTTVSYALAPAGVFITLPQGGSNGFNGFDSFGNISNVIGSSHDDRIFSGPGTNLIFGGGGNDFILGRGGTDTAGFSGARSDYFALFVNSDEVKITDLRPGSPDGTDDVVSVHSFQFSDGTYSLAQLNALSEIENSGSTILGTVGDNYFLFTSGTAGEPELKYQGNPISVSGFASFAIGAEQVAGGGYDVAWESFSPGPDGTTMYTVWSVDSNGNYVSTLLGPVVASDQALEALETTTFSQDLNRDGIIGVPNVTAIETFGSTELGQASTFYYMDPVAGGTGPELKYTGAPFVAGAWAPIGAEKTSTGL